MKKPLISIIVPVYKSEQYLEECINSIRNQTYKNLEIILIDDGSPDACGEICEEFAKKDSRIVVLHKENGGQSSARNMGLDYMTGEYVGFVDSDDWIEPNMFEFLYDNLYVSNAQISACGIQWDYDNGKIEYSNSDFLESKNTKIYSQKEALANAIWNKIFTYSLCDKLYEVSVFEEIRLIEGQIYEDEEAIPRIIECAKILAYNSKPLYHYRMTRESTIRGKFSEKMFIRLDIAKNRASDYYTRFPELYEDVLAFYYMEMLAIIHDCSGEKRFKQKRSEMIGEVRKVPRKIAFKMPKNSRIKLLILKVCPIMYELVLKINDYRKNKVIYS